MIIQLNQGDTGLTICEVEVNTVKKGTEISENALELCSSLEFEFTLRITSLKQLVKCHDNS